jgi:glycosyltransferase A (GT-A) superfamily protein (DUF2064 family)
MARAPRRGEVRRALEPVLGVDGCLALQTALVEQAIEWAGGVAPGAVYVAYEPPDSPAEIRGLSPDETIFFPQNGDGIGRRLADAAGRVFARTDGPLVVAWPNLPRLRPEHASAALDDLAAGCDVVLGPVVDGGFYLVGLARPLPDLFALPEQTWRGGDAVGVGAEVIRDGNLELGLLRVDRALQRPADVRAALVDPLTPEPILRILSRYGLS